MYQYISQTLNQVSSLENLSKVNYHYVKSHQDHNGSTKNYITPTSAKVDLMIKEIKRKGKKLNAFLTAS